MREEITCFLNIIQPIMSEKDVTEKQESGQQTERRENKSMKGKMETNCGVTFQVLILGKLETLHTKRKEMK